MPPIVTAGEEAVGGDVDAVAGAAQGGVEGVAEGGEEIAGDEDVAVAERVGDVARRLEEPEGRVGGGLRRGGGAAVVGDDAGLRGGAVVGGVVGGAEVVGHAVGEEAVLDGGDHLAVDSHAGVDLAGDEVEPRQRDQRVAAPHLEPGVAGDDAGAPREVGAEHLGGDGEAARGQGDARARVFGEEGGAGGFEEGGGVAGGELVDGGDEVAGAAIVAGGHLEEARGPEVLGELEAAVALGQVLEAAPPVGGADERPVVPEADARQLAPRLDAHLPCPALDRAQLDPLEHAAVLAGQVVEAPRGEEGAEREEHGAGAVEGVAEDDGVLAADEGEGDLEHAAGDVVRPARERILVEAVEVEGAGLGVDAGELVLGELPLAGAGRGGVRCVVPASGSVGRLRGISGGRDGDVDVGEQDVASARRVEGGDEEAVVAARVHAGERRAGVGAGAVGVQPLAAGAGEIAADGDRRVGYRLVRPVPAGGIGDDGAVRAVDTVHRGHPPSSASSAASRMRSRGGSRPVQRVIARAAWRTSIPRPSTATRPRPRAARRKGVTRGLYTTS